MDGICTMLISTFLSFPTSCSDLRLACRRIGFTDVPSPVWITPQTGQLIPSIFQVPIRVCLWLFFLSTVMRSEGLWRVLKGFDHGTSGSWSLSQLLWVNAFIINWQSLASYCRCIVILFTIHSAKSPMAPGATGARRAEDPGGPENGQGQPAKLVGLCWKDGFRMC